MFSLGFLFNFLNPLQLNKSQLQSHLGRARKNPTIAVYIFFQGMWRQQGGESDEMVKGSVN